jgi:hypothetical protein
MHVESRYLCDVVGERPDSNHLNGLKKPDDAAVYFGNRVKLGYLVFGHP